MATLKQLQKQNEKLRKIQSKITETKRLQDERARLIRENKQLAFRTKHPKAVARSQKIVNTTAKFGIAAFRGIQKYGRRLAEAERREQSRNRTLKKKVKTKTKVKKKK